MEDNEESILRYQEEHIRSLTLEELQKVEPVIDKRHRGVSNQMQKLKDEKNKLQQTVSGLELKKLEMERQVAKKNSISQDLTLRLTKAERELAQVKIMCPMYRTQMSRFLEGASQSETCKFESNVALDDLRPLEESLSEQKLNLEKEITEKQQIIDEFIGKYLH